MLWRMMDREEWFFFFVCLFFFFLRLAAHGVPWLLGFLYLDSCWWMLCSFCLGCSAKCESGSQTEKDGFSLRLVSSEMMKCTFLIAVGGRVKETLQLSAENSQLLFSLNWKLMVLYPGESGVPQGFIKDVHTSFHPFKSTINYCWGFEGD